MERKHRHLLEIARALSFQSKAHMSFWGECVQCATYLINRTPLSSLNYITPYEKSCNHKPEYAHLRSFGCLCFASTLKQGRNKFEPRADPCVFMGYPHGTKGYKLYNLKTHTMFVSRDVIFYEQFFPFHFLNNTPTKPLPQFFLPTNPHSNSTLPTDFPLPTPPLSLPDLNIPSPNTASSPPTPPPPPNPIPRHSTRVSRPPSHLKDYVCAYTSSHWCGIVQ